MRCGETASKMSHVRNAIITVFKTIKKKQLFGSLCLHTDPFLIA